jgi:single-strand DNA-binding protein
MITLNKVFMVGNLARDPDLRHTPSGTPVTEFRLAVSDSYTTSSGEKHDRTCFIDVVSWRKLAESCAEHLKKGSPVFVEGRLEQDTWTTNDGQRRSRIRVVAYSVQFIRRETERSASGRHIRIVERGGNTIRDEDGGADEDDLEDLRRHTRDDDGIEDVGDDVTL